MPCRTANDRWQAGTVATGANTVRLPQTPPLIAREEFWALVTATFAIHPETVPDHLTVPGGQGRPVQYGRPDGFRTLWDQLKPAGMIIMAGCPGMGPAARQDGGWRVGADRSAGSQGSFPVGLVGGDERGPRRGCDMGIDALHPGGAVAHDQVPQNLPERRGCPCWSRGRGVTNAAGTGQDRHPAGLGSAVGVPPPYGDARPRRRPPAPDGPAEAGAADTSR